MPKNPDAKNYNRTHLPLELAEERQILHRDYLAHCLRWSHVIKCIDIGETVLDLGSADGPMGMALYTNRYRPARYLGCDIREGMCEQGRKKLAKAPWAEFLVVDLCKDFKKVIDTWFGEDPCPGPSIITSFEFIEHIPEKEVEPFLFRVKGMMNDKSRFFLSTPCYDGKNKAANHVKEWTYQELKDLLLKVGFKIDAHFGTFMSQRDFKQAAVDGDVFAQMILDAQVAGKVSSLFNHLHGYYDSNLLSILFAPLFPQYSRNCLWRLKV